VDFFFFVFFVDFLTDVVLFTTGFVEDLFTAAFFFVFFVDFFLVGFCFAGVFFFFVFFADFFGGIASFLFDIL